MLMIQNNKESDCVKFLCCLNDVGVTPVADWLSSVICEVLRCYIKSTKSYEKWC